MTTIVRNVMGTTSTEPMFDPPSWMAMLRKAMDKNIPQGTILGQLCTIRKRPDGDMLNGRPAVRTINIRQLTGTRLFFCTDTRSGKAIDVSKGNSHGEICIYIPAERIQIRISGILTLDCDGDGAQQMWDSLTPRERLWWAWPSPAAPRAHPDEFNVVPPSEKPSCFCVATLIPDFVDETHLSSVPFDRFVYVRKCDPSNHNSEIWTKQSINP